MIFHSSCVPGCLAKKAEPCPSLRQLSWQLHRFWHFTTSRYYRGIGFSWISCRFCLKGYQKKTKNRFSIVIYHHYSMIQWIYHCNLLIHDNSWFSHYTKCKNLAGHSPFSDTSMLGLWCESRRKWRASGAGLLHVARRLGGLSIWKWWIPQSMAFKIWVRKMMMVVYKPHEFSFVIGTINHSDIGVINQWICSGATLISGLPTIRACPENECQG